jgi:hypothetical protein
MEHCGIVTHACFGKDTVLVGKLREQGSQLRWIENTPTMLITKLQEGNEVSYLLKLIAGKLV